MERKTLITDPVYGLKRRELRHADIRHGQRLRYCDHLRAFDPKLAQTYLLAKVLGALLVGTEDVVSGVVRKAGHFCCIFCRKVGKMRPGSSMPLCAGGPFRVPKHFTFRKIFLSLFYRVS